MTQVDTIAGNSKTPYSFADDSSYLERARLLAPLVNAEAKNTEDSSTTSQVVVEALTESNLYWALLPKALGGGGLSASEVIPVVEEISRADGATGWSFMVNVYSTMAASGFLHPSATAQLWGGAEKALIAGQLLPKTPLKKVDGGYLINGNFMFASGSGAATHIGVGFLVADANGDVILDADGQPEARQAYMPKELIEFKGGWNVWGLVGTGSYDYRITNQVVPEEFTQLVFNAEPVRDEAVFKLPALFLAVSGHAAVALGIAKRALEEVATITATKVRTGHSGPLAESERFAVEFSRKEALLRATRLYLLDVVRQGEEAVASGEPVSAELFSRMRQVATWSQEVARDTALFAHEWAGTSSIRDTSVLGRCLRNALVATQHALVDTKSLADACADILPGYRLASS